MVVEETTGMWQQLVDEGTELVQVRTCERIGIARPPVTAHVLGSKHKKDQKQGFF